MAQAPKYTRSTGFAAEELANVGGRSTVRTAQVDAELDRVGVSVNALQENLELIQRDDGQIRDGVVGLGALSSAVQKYLTASSGTVRGAWLTATAYSAKDVVTQGTNTYIAAISHTSGTFATDLAANKWVLLQIGTAAAAALVTFTPTATVSATNVQAAIDLADTQLRTLLIALIADLANTVSEAKAAGQLGYGLALNLLYAKDTIGAILAAQNPEMNVWAYLTPAQRADARLATPLIASDAAFASAWAVVKANGGKLVIPPGNYRLSAQLLFDRTQPKPIEVYGVGATLFADAAVTGAAIKVYGGYNQFSLEIYGLSFNHRGNTTVQGCFEVRWANSTRIVNCHSEFGNTKAGYYFALIGSDTVGVTEDDRNSYWCAVKECSTRRRTGGDGTIAQYGVILEGAANATTLEGNNFTECQYPVVMIAAPTTKTLANSVAVLGNFFEANTGAAVEVRGTAGQYGPTGLRILGNRVETTPTFLSITAGGAMLAASQPPILEHNYLTAGSVTNWIVNSTNYPVSVHETRFPGFGPTVTNTLYLAGGLTMVFPNGTGLTMQNDSGNADYATAWMAQGGYRYWTNTGNTKFYSKGGVPTTNTDGTVVGTQT